MPDRILPPTFAELAPSDPREVGGFALLGRLGSGGMGTAFLAEAGDQWVVIKILKPELADDTVFRARLRRELDSLKRIDGTGAVRIVHEDLDAATPWFAMEYVEGQTLADRVDTAGPLHGNALTSFARGLAEQVEAIHRAGIIHRDIKPSNIVISPAGPRIIDFGIAVMDERTAMTSTGVLVGTLGWASPEQVAGDDVGPPADIHAWGLCVLYAATGSSPFAAETAASMVYKVVHMNPAVPPELPGGLSPAISAALRKDPAARPPVKDLIAGRVTSGRPQPDAGLTDDVTQVETRRRSRGTLLGVAAGLLVALALAGTLALIAATQSGGAGLPEAVQVTVTAEPEAPAPQDSAPAPDPNDASTPEGVTDAPTRTAPVGYEEQKTANALLSRINRGQWSNIPSMCTPPSLCTRQFVDFFQPRFRSGQFLRGDVGMLYSCAESVPRGWESGCATRGTSVIHPDRWLAQFDWTCSKNGTQGIQREVGYFEFDYSQGTRISAFDPVTVLASASQCTS